MPEYINPIRVYNLGFFFAYTMMAPKLDNDPDIKLLLVLSSCECNVFLPHGSVESFRCVIVAFPGKIH